MVWWGWLPTSAGVHSMFDEPFAQKTSTLHALDPRVRLLAAVGCSVCLAVVRTPEAAGLGLVGAGLLLAMSRPPWRALCHRLWVVNIFILFLWLTVPLTMPGPILASWGPLDINRQGVAVVWLATLKANALVMLFLALVASMNAATLGWALERLRCPNKLVFLFLSTYRYVHVIAEEWHKLHVAARLRGFVPRTNTHTYRTFGNMLGMVFVRSMDRAHRVYEAMLLRGFSGVFRSVVTFQTSRCEGLFSLAVALWLAAIIILELFVKAYHG